MYSVDIDTGGTMTDTMVSGGGEPLLIKVESTPHDVTVSFLQSLQAAATALGHASLTDFLDEVRLIRWSSTLTSNVLAQRKGPKLGLLVSAGHEADLYADDPSLAARVIPELVRPEHITGLPPDADRATVIGILKRLIDQGIRRINVSLAGAFPEGTREQEILAIVGEQFPDHFLGSVPAVAGSEMLMRPDDMSRTFFALINSYVHNALANSLFKAEDALKVDHGWRGDILVGHLNGGVARIGKTKAVDTIESGPLFGTHASAHVAGELSLPRVLAVDIGGTTGKASAVADGRVEMQPNGEFFGIPVRMPMAVLRSNALGGGSVARVKDGVVTLGPDSMGAAPGPACYGLGGRQATLTDALVVLGLVSPTAFLNGRRVLKVDLAREAIERHVAQPLDVSADEAALRIYAEAVRLMANLCRETLAATQWPADPAPVLFAYGGNGPLFATALAEALGLREVRVFALGTVFSAYGSAIADVMHVYERALVSSDRASELHAAAEAVLGQARRDLAGEGFDPAAASYAFETEDATGQRLASATLDELSSLTHGAPALLRLTARFAIPRDPLPELPPAMGTPADTRPSALGTDGHVAIHTHASLRGRTLEGPVVVDGGTFTWLVGKGWRLAVDLRGDATLSRGDT